MIATLCWSYNYPTIYQATFAAQLPTLLPGSISSPPYHMGGFVPRALFPHSVPQTIIELIFVDHNIPSSGDILPSLLHILFEVHQVIHLSKYM